VSSYPSGRELTVSGNQGLDFRYVNREGFGWTNASYQIGISFLSTGMRRAVAACTAPWDYFDLPVPELAFDRNAVKGDKIPHEVDPEAAKRRRASDARSPTLQQTIAQLKGMAV
jgi:alpha,alpha-trehalase